MSLETAKSYNQKLTGYAKGLFRGGGFIKTQRIQEVEGRELMQKVKTTTPKCPTCGQSIVKDELKNLSISKKTRNLVAEHLDSLPMYHMQFRFLSIEAGRVRDCPAENDEWFLPLMKRKVKKWNEEAGNPDSDPNHENYAWYVRVK